MRRTCLIAVLVLAGTAARAGLGEMVEAIAQSQFDFESRESDLPRPPICWLRGSYYGAGSFTSDDPALDGLTFQQTTFSHSLFLPVYVAPRDILAAGYYYGLSSFEFEGGPIEDGSVHMIGGGVAWLHQMEQTNWMTLAFASPLVHSSIGGGSPWETEWYLGGVARYRRSDELQWMFGGIYIRSFGENLIYPYVGAVWTPTADWSVAALMPWPAVAYAFSRKCVARFGASPSGAQWVAEDDESVNLDIGGWDVGLTLEYEIARRIWLGGTVGWSGLNSFQINNGDRLEQETSLDSEPFIRIGLAFRP
jgi:hypothetical protein